MSKLLLWGVDTAVSVTREVQGRRLSMCPHLMRGCLNAAALRSLFEITHISYSLNSFLGFYELNGSFSDASGGVYTVLGNNAGLASSPPTFFGKHHSQERIKNTLKQAVNKKTNAFLFLFVAKLR